MVVKGIDNKTIVKINLFGTFLVLISDIALNAKITLIAKKIINLIISMCYPSKVPYISNLRLLIQF